jgi:energy-coupling factor transporter ATP-binding protein EcfA2
MGSLILNSLEIRRFRAFRHLQIERLGRINLVVGKNNVGKSNLLEALQLYARRASTPTFIWETLAARNRIRLPFVDIDDVLSSLKYLFYGRRAITPGTEPIQIGPINTPGEMLSIAVDWSVVQIGEDGSQNVRPLEAGEDYIRDNLLPRFTIQAGGTSLSYPIDPSIAQRIFRLNAKEITCVFVSAYGLSGRQITELWDGIALTNLEKDVLAALRLIAPGVEGLNLVSIPLSQTGERGPIVRIVGIDEPLPLSDLGDGMQRMFGIALALVNAKGGLLLIDEIENGLHYSVLPDLWRLIFQVARRLNIQVFATTHSWDCIEGFQKAAQEDNQDEGLLIRLESKKGEIVATLFDERRLGIATREQIEVR